MKRTMYEAARHTPKRKAARSNRAGRAKTPEIVVISGVYALYRKQIKRWLFKTVIWLPVQR